MRNEAALIEAGIYTIEANDVASAEDAIRKPRPEGSSAPPDKPANSGQ